MRLNERQTASAHNLATAHCTQNLIGTQMVLVIFACFVSAPPLSQLAGIIATTMPNQLPGPRPEWDPV